MKKQFTKKFVSLLLALVIIPQLWWMPVYANESQAQTTATYSPWAARTIFEGERMGLIPIEWHTNMQAPLSFEAQSKLHKNLIKKLHKLELEPNKDISALSFILTESRTRKDFLESLYNWVSFFELPESMTVAASEKDKAISFMIKNSVLRGDGNNYNLDAICTLEDAAIFATRIVEKIVTETDKGSSGFFWKVSKDNNTVYLLGSIHLAKHDVYPMNSKIKEAFEDSDALVVEADIISDIEGLQYLQSKMTYTDGSTIKDHISEETYAKLKEIMTQLGVPESHYNTYKAWALSQQLSSLVMQKEDGIGSSAYSANLGIDYYFLINSAFMGKTVKELEGIKFQADLFDNLSSEFQENQLIETLKSLEDPSLKEEAANLADAWLNQWIEGDVEAFTESYLASIGEGEYKELIFGRDENMTNKITQYLNSENGITYFVVAGAGHMVSDSSIVARLQELGYEVEQIK